MDAEATSVDRNRNWYRIVSKDERRRKLQTEVVWNGIETTSTHTHAAPPQCTAQQKKNQYYVCFFLSLVNFQLKWNEKSNAGKLDLKSDVDNKFMMFLDLKHFTNKISTNFLNEYSSAVCVECFFIFSLAFLSFAPIAKCISFAATHFIHPQI